MSPRKARRLPAAMPRRPRGGLPPGHASGEADPPRPGPEHRELGPDADWMVRSVPGAATGKTYRCPGCDQEIRPGTAHVVVWPADGRVAERRHWHRPCWEGRLRRHARARRGGR